MLEIRLNCENCNTSLPNESDQAMICTYECTFCKDCVDNILKNVCPNCGGGFEKRPTRPMAQLENHPPRKDSVYKPVEQNKYSEIYKNIDPRNR